MPLTTITEIEFNYILDWMKEKFGSDVFKKGIFYEQQDEDVIDELYEAGADLFGDDNTFRTALYEQKLLNDTQQARIDVKVKAFLDKHPRKAKNDFPFTTLSDE